jgi:hypothetical protein
MNVVNHSLNRRIRQALYALKRGFGSSVKLYKLLDSTTVYETGVKTTSETVISIHRCIVLPAKIQREVVQTIAIISANKEFAYGGSYDADSRIFIIDARDVPKGYVIQIDDWLEYDNYRYNPKVIEELEQHTGWTITAKRVVGPVHTSVELLSEPDFVPGSDEGIINLGPTSIIDVNQISSAEKIVSVDLTNSLAPTQEGAYDKS